MAKKTKKSKAVEPGPQKDLWTVSGLEKRTRELIVQGVLVSGGLDKLVQALSEEFAEKLAAEKIRVTKVALTQRMKELIWTKKVDKDLWRAYSNRMVQKFRDAYGYIPEGEVTKRVKELKGLTTSVSVTQQKAGMGRLSTEELPADAGSYEFPSISYGNPLVISEASEGQFPVINGALVGIKFTDIEGNTLRRALADMRKRGAAGVVLTNIMEIWTKKTAGPLAALRAAVSGIQINPQRFPEDYRQEVQDILDGKIDDKLIYQTLEDRFGEILDGLHKITHRKDNKGPEFPGPVYVVLGHKEEELIFSAAYYECRYLTIVEQNKIEAELNMASHRFEVARDDRDHVGMEKWGKEVERLGLKKARTIISNTADPQYEYYRRRMRALVVKRLEETIPNCTVISQGSTWVRADRYIVKIHIPSSAVVKDSYLAEYGNSYGGEVFTNTLADQTIICPPYSLDHRMVGREDSKDGQPVTKYIHVAPSCLDGEYLREELKDISKMAHPVQKLVFNNQFKPGVLLISWGNGMMHADPLPIAKLDRVKGKVDVSNFAFPYPRTKYVTFKLNTDNHFGGSPKRYIWDPVERVHHGTDEAANQMMRRLGVLNPADIRVHFSAEMDDPTNGDLWFKPRYRPDPQVMSIIHFERWLQQMTKDVQRAAERSDQASVLQMCEEINKISIAQLNFRGEDFPFHQMMQVYDRHIDPQIDFYSAVLGRFEKSGIEIRGISKINRSISDTRDLGVINFSNGNHRSNTLQGADLEGEYFARHLIARMGQLSQWREHEEFLRAAIRAPRFGHVTFGWGTIQAPGAYPWGIRVHNSPARQSGWSDILGAVIKNDLARGDDSYGLGKYVNVTFYGDKHFYAKAETERNIYVMCAAGVHTDTYGSEGGFPPNNTGVCFVSLPADGPDAGPILMRMLSHDTLRDWFANPWKFEWDKFLPEPV